MLLPKIMAQPKEENQFTPNRALVVGKFSRYEFEKHRHPDLDEKQFIDCVSELSPAFLIHLQIAHLLITYSPYPIQVESRGSDYKSLLFHHNIHMRNRDHIVDCLRRRGIETKIVNRFGYTDELIQWADLIITSGGDGTFLMTASKIKTADKVIIGVNSDPTRSVGHLCLPMKYSDQFEGALDRILTGQFEWQYRQRIRVTIEGQNAFDDPIELHDQQLMHPECRFFEMEPFKKSSSSKNDNDGNRIAKMRRTLPFRALNEVFVGESLSSRVSYFELSINDHEQQKIRSSGITICTGTGSTSWSFNINKLTTQCVSNIFKIINEECFDNKEALSAKDKGMVAKVTDRFNSTLIYDPSKLSMAYTIRDPVVFGRRFMSNPRDFANRLIVKSRMTDAHIVMDGGLSYPFNDGSRAIFEILPEDALKTIKLE